MKKENYLDSRTPAERKRDSKIKSKTTTSSSLNKLPRKVSHENYLWAVYDKENVLVSLGATEREAKETALKLSNYRWTFQTFDTDWEYLRKDGYRTSKVKLDVKAVEISSKDESRPKKN